MPDAPEAKVRARAGSIGFPERAADTPVENLSGGEKSRLLIGLATFGGPHLIMLDEPTNHLDIDSRAALIEAINDYPGAVMLVSHDRYLLEACADRLWLVADGTVTPFDGDLDEYQKLTLSERGGGNGSEAAAARAPSRAELRRARPSGGSQLAPLRARIKTAEAAIGRIGGRDRTARCRARGARGVRRSGPRCDACQDARRGRSRACRGRRRLACSQHRLRRRGCLKANAGQALLAVFGLAGFFFFAGAGGGSGSATRSMSVSRPAVKR